MMFVRRRWYWLAGIIVILVGFSRLRLDTEVLNLLPGAVPAVRGLRLYQKHFTNARELIVTVRGAEPEDAETAVLLLAEAWRRETNLTASVVWRPPWLEQPEQMAEFIAYLWLNQSPAMVARLTNSLAPGRLAAVADETRNRLATSLSPSDIARLT